MRITLSSSALGDRLQLLSKVINEKNILPILNCYLFEVKDNLLTITASDGENTIQCTMETETSDSDGSIALPARRILDPIRELPEQPVVIELNAEEGYTEVFYQNGRGQFAAQGGSDYPQPKEVEYTSVISVSGDVLEGCISRTLFSVTTGDPRPVMNGIYFDLTPECLTVVGSDGHKLVRNKILDTTSSTPASFILPKKPATLLKYILEKNKGDIVIKFNANNAVIQFTDGLLVCRLIEGRYPDYNSVIPRNNPNEIIVNRKLLMSAVRRVSAFTCDLIQLVKIHIDSNGMELSSQAKEYSTNAKENVPCSYTGKPMDIGFKSTTLIDILTNIDSEDVVIRLSDPSRAGVIMPVDQPEGAEVVMLMMPMLLND